MIVVQCGLTSHEPLKTEIRRNAESSGQAAWLLGLVVRRAYRQNLRLKPIAINNAMRSWTGVGTQARSH